MVFSTCSTVTLFILLVVNNWYIIMVSCLLTLLCNPELSINSFTSIPLSFFPRSPYTAPSLPSSLPPSFPPRSSRRGLHQKSRPTGLPESTSSLSTSSHWWATRSIREHLPQYSIGVLLRIATACTISQLATSEMLFFAVKLSTLSTIHWCPHLENKLCMVYTYTW